MSVVSGLQIEVFAFLEPNIIERLFLNLSSMAWNPSLVTTAGSEIRSGDNVNAAMTPMGFHINKPSTNRKRNRLQQPPIHHNNHQASLPSHLALSDPMMSNSDVSTAWNDAPSAPHSWLTSPNAPIMGHTLSPISTVSFQQPMQPTLSIPQLEYNTDVFCLRPELGYSENPIGQRSSLILPRCVDHN